MTSSANHMPAPPESYRSRRAALAARLTRPIVIFAGNARARNYVGNDYPYRAGSTYLYYGGPSLEGACWLIEPGSDGESGCSLFVSKPGPDYAVWFGETLSDEQIVAAAGIPASNIFDLDTLADQSKKCETAYIGPECTVTHRSARTLDLRNPTDEELLIVIDQRLIKDDHELAAMRSAAQATINAHRRAMAATSAGKTEAVIAAEFFGSLVRDFCEPSFSPIVTVRGHVLHASGSGNRLENGQLLLLDGGAEEPGGYACDVTRVWPINGQFTQIQKQLYETVLRAQRAAIEMCTPGQRYRDAHDRAGEVICEGLVDAGLFRGDPAELAGRRAQTLFFTHGLGHLIGLDVHDMEDFGDLAGYAAGRTRRTQFGDKFLRMDHDLLPRMTMTIEPGIYLVPAVWRRDDLVGPFADCVNRPAIDELLDAQFGGIRLEDTICVSENGAPENLTSDIPIEPSDVAAAVGRALP